MASSTRRNVNPGNYVQVGQNLMAIRSLNKIWVDANFKETQLRDLRIGQPVDLYVEMYGGTHVFKGRISGFTDGTGSTLALLPPENATGNFVKVVQRLPVRIDVVDYNPDQTPLFIGTSVIPYVFIDKIPTDRTPGSFSRPMCRSRRAPVQPPARRAPGNERRVAGAPDFPIPWNKSLVVVAIVAVPTFMEVLNTTIAERLGGNPSRQ